MSTVNFVEQEAANDPVLTSSVTSVFTEAFPNHPADAVASGNLLSAAAQTFAQIGGYTENIPYGKQITIAITLTSGTVLNYGIELSKDPNDPQRANIVGLAGATTSVLASEWLTGIATGLAGGAVAAGASPVLVTIAAVGAVVGVSYLAGNLASVVAGSVYDLFITPDTEMQRNKDTGMRSITTNLTGQEFTEKYGNISTSEATSTMVNGMSFVQWWAKHSLKGLIDSSTGLYRQLFTTAKIIQDPTILSPIVLDLDRDGVETTNVKDGAYFDHDGNGFAEQTGWAGADDGILVMDKNGNGTIDDGKELFGNETLLSDGTKASNGFQALAELDGNSDGKIDSNDAAFAQLKVWQDINGDGYSTSGELKSLSELGIQSINTGYTNSTTVDAQGNEHKQIGSFTWNDGTTSAAEDVWVQRDTTYTIATEWLDVPADIAALPDLQGYGNVYDLHQAMVRDTSGQLKSLVEQFMAATDPAARTSLMEQILFKWTGSDTVDPNSRGSSIEFSLSTIVTCASESLILR
ncbi:MAG: hypothetical protein ACOYW7_10030 [Nitrospirota bacterium]